MSSSKVWRKRSNTVIEKWRIRLLLVHVLAMIFGLIVANWWLFHQDSSSVNADLLADVDLPPDEDIEEVLVAIIDNWHRSKPKFNLPRKYIPVVVGMLRPGVAVPQLSLGKAPIMVSLTIKTHDGAEFVILVREGGQNPLQYTMNGLSCIRGITYRGLYRREQDNLIGAHVDEGNTLTGLCFFIWREQQGTATQRQIRECVELLEISMGKRRQLKAP